MTSQRFSVIGIDTASQKAMGVILFAAISILGWAVLRGVYIGPDSLTYLLTAELFFSDNHNLASVQFPPLYPILLKLAISFGISDVIAAKLLNVLIWLLGFFLCFHIFNRLKSTSKRDSLALSLSLMSSYVIFSTYTQMMSESVFIFLVFLNIALLHAYAQHRTVALLVLVSFIASLSALSRYAGLAVMISTLISLLWYTPEKTLRQLFKTFILWGVSSALFGFWILRNNILYGTFTGREVVSHERQFESAYYYLEVFSRLYFPQILPESLRLILFSGFVLVTLTALVYFFWRLNKARSIPDGDTKVFISIILTVLFTQTALLIIALFVDPFLPVQQRILTPIYSLLLLLHFLLIAHFFMTTKIRHIAALYTGLFLLLNLSRLVAHELKDDDFKYGYASGIYADSPLIEFMQSANPDAVIASNGDDVMGWHLQRAVQAVPKKTNPRTARENSAFNEQFNRLYCQLNQTNGYLVYFDTIDWRSYLPTLQSIQRNYPFSIVKHTVDGVVLQTNKSASTPLCP